MNDITFFQRRTKKRYLSDESKTTEDPKKVGGGALDCSQTS